MAQTADVFLSYSREDKARVLDLAGAAAGRRREIWIDQGGIDGAALWGESIVRALEGAKVLLLMVTPSAVSSHNVAKEVMLTSERKGHILPVHLEPTTIPLGLKYPLAGIQHIEFYHGDPDENLQAILRSLDGLGVHHHAAAACCEPPSADDAARRGRRRACSRVPSRSAGRWPCCRSTTSAPTRRPTISATD